MSEPGTNEWLQQRRKADDAELHRRNLVSDQQDIPPGVVIWPVTAHAAAAYNPHQGAMSFSRDHAVLDQPLTAARFHRDKGDALCKPARKFWGLYPGGSNKVDCPECLARAARYGVTLP